MIAGSDPNGKTFNGYVTDDDRTEVNWRCSHRHKNRTYAVACAQAEIDRREGKKK